MTTPAANRPTPVDEAIGARPPAADRARGRIYTDRVVLTDDDTIV